MSAETTPAHTLRELVALFQVDRSGAGSKTALHDALVTALNGAVTLEFATIPPYLTALWTIKDERHSFANSLRNILQEEMLHLALVCNMLVSIGGDPQISSAAPAYPGKLPLGVHPELTVPLGRFSPKMLDVFMEIERPEHVDPVHGIADDDPGIEEHAEFTIGQLYGQILAAFRELKPDFSQVRQVTGPLSWIPIISLADVETAIEIIERQGEGSVGRPKKRDSVGHDVVETQAEGSVVRPEERRGHLAHYWRFAEMRELRRLERAQDSTWGFGASMPFDFDADVWPVASVPRGGYGPDQTQDPEVLHLLRQFNITYSKLLDYLQQTWSGPAGQAMIMRAIEAMFELERYAKPLMRMPRPDGAGNYAPDFRYLPPDQR